MSNRIPDDVFEVVVSNAPLVSIDLLIKRKDEPYSYLLGRRNNEPAKGTWFVPGGIIRKGELFEDAFKRISAAEVGEELDFENTALYGVYQHLYDKGKFDTQQHYIVIAVSVVMPSKWDPNVLSADDQHGEFKWWKTGEMLKSSMVHKNTKAYFDGRPVV
jgi:colanic acid biosynthesis protein WcaH